MEGQERTIGTTERSKRQDGFRGKIRIGKGGEKDMKRGRRGERSEN
jgi:hypothetical protein